MSRYQAIAAHCDCPIGAEVALIAEKLIIGKTLKQKRQMLANMANTGRLGATGMKIMEHLLVRIPHPKAKLVYSSGGGEKQ